MLALPARGPPQRGGLIAAALWALLLPAQPLPAGAVTGNAVGWGYLGNLPVRDTDAYFAMLRTDYKLRLQEPYLHYTIDLLVDPCRDPVETGGLGKRCCSSVNIAGCQHHPEVVAGPDLQIAYFQNAHIPNCRGTVFEGDPNCGTYIEVHRPGDVKILADVRVDAEPFTNGYLTTSITTHRLCLGEHELWWVVRTRSGPIVQAIRPFFILRPSCAAPRGAIAPQEVLEMPGLP